MTWNYRVIKKNDELAIYSVYYDNEGKIVSYSETPAFIVGDDLEDLKTELKLMSKALKKEIIDLS